MNIPDFWKLNAAAVYTRDEFMETLGIKRRAFDGMRKRGLKTRMVNGHVVVRGCEALEWWGGHTPTASR